MLISSETGEYMNTHILIKLLNVLLILLFSFRIMKWVIEEGHQGDKDEMSKVVVLDMSSKFIYILIFSNIPNSLI